MKSFSRTSAWIFAAGNGCLSVHENIDISFKMFRIPQLLIHRAGQC